MVPEYIRELFLYKIHVEKQRKVNVRARAFYNFFAHHVNTLTICQALKACIHSVISKVTRNKTVFRLHTFEMNWISL